MAGSSHDVNIDLNRKHPATRISEFLSDLSRMDDDLKKVKKLDSFICSLTDELKKIAGSQHQFTFSKLFLIDAIAKFRELKRVCEVNAVSKGLVPCKSIFEKDAHLNNHQVINLESDDEREVNNVSNGPFVHGGTSVSPAPMIQCESTSFDPKGKRVINVSGTPPLMVGQEREPPLKRRRMWSGYMYRRFLNVMNKLGGPLAATPKKIKDHMQVADITEDEINIVLQEYMLDNGCRVRGRSPLPNAHMGWSLNNHM